MNACTQKKGLHVFAAEEFELYGDSVGGGQNATVAFGDNSVGGFGADRSAVLIGQWMGTATTVAGVAALFGLSCTRFGRRLVTLALLYCQSRYDPGTAGYVIFGQTAADAANSDIELAQLQDTLDDRYYDPSEL